MLATLCATSLIFAQKPNVIFIMADDLGYGELGCYGQTTIKTPHIDDLAQGGMKFTQFYSGSPVCAPTRSTLLEGKSTRDCFVRENKEYGDFTPDGKEGQEPLPDGTYTIGKMFQDQGYVTGAIGKWGLGGPESTGRPLEQGFDYFFGYNCQRQAHNFYPVHLWENENKVILNNPKFHAHQRFPEGLDPNDSKNYDRYKGNEYSNDLMADKALEFIERNEENKFFLYLPFTIPHVALQVPDEALDQYKGKLDEEPYLGTRSYLPHQYPKSAYAAMITRLDDYVGRIVKLLEEKGLAKNTVIFFTSDNGPTWVSGITPDLFDSTAGLKGRKAQLWEGGIRVPMIAYWPGKINPSTTTDHPSALWDVFDTCADIVGGKQIKNEESISFLPALLEQHQPEHKYMYWEFAAHGKGQAVRMDDWKAVHFNNGPDKGKTFLYYLKRDPQEKIDLADNFPDIVTKAEKIMQSRIPSHVPGWEFEFVKNELRN